MQKDTEELNHELNAALAVEDFLTDNQENFHNYTLSEYLDMLLNEKHLTKSEVIDKSHLEQIYAYHIFAGRKKNPSRSKILALALAMKLSIDETQRLLYYAGSERLYVRNTWDSVILYALNHHMTVPDTNMLLLKLSENPLLGSPLEN